MKRKKFSLVPAKDNDEALGNVNEHYISAAYGFMIAKYVLLTVLAIFLVVMLSVYRSYITYDNLVYLLRDFETASYSVSRDFEDVSYYEQSNMDFAVYKGELAVAGAEKITLYNSSSAKTFEYASEMETPILIPSDKYLFAYDLGGKTYSVFTNVTRVLHSESESVIENASLSENGEFLLVCRARDSKYVVSYYSSSFENEANYYKSNFVSAAALSTDGDTVAIATVDISSSSFSSEIEFYKRGSEEVFSVYNAGDLFPAEIGSFEDGSFYVVGDNAVLFFGPDGALISRYEIANEKITAMSCSGNIIAVSFSGDVLKDKGRIILFDNRGNISYNIEVEHKITDISHNESCIYVLASEKIYKYTYDSEEAAIEECEFDTQYVIEAGDVALAGTKNFAGVFFKSSAEGN